MAPLKYHVWIPLPFVRWLLLKGASISSFYSICAAYIQRQLLFKGSFYSRKYGNLTIIFECRPSHHCWPTLTVNKKWENKHFLVISLLINLSHHIFFFKMLLKSLNIVILIFQPENLRILIKFFPKLLNYFVWKFLYRFCIVFGL